MKQLAIVGSETSTRDQAPWQDESIDIWVFNEAAAQDWCKRCNGVLQLHLPEVYRSPHNRTDRQHWEWLQKEHGYPIWMQDKDQAVPDSVRYPMESICETFLSGFRWGEDNSMIRFFTSTVAYAIALAIWKGYQKISLYGIEMRSNTEYQYQRDNVAFWVGLALGEDVDVVMHSAMGIFDQPLYGYEGSLTYSLERIRGEIPYLRKQSETRLQEYTQAKEADRDALESASYYTTHAKTIDAAIENGYADGMLSEAERYLKREDVSRHEFEQMAAGTLMNHTSYLSMMNYESGRAETYYSLRLMDKYQQATEKQLSLAYTAGFEKGKSYFNKVHMLEMDIMLRSAGGQRAQACVQGA